MAPLPLPSQKWTIDLLFKNNRIGKHVANFKTPQPPFRMDVIKLWSEKTLNVEKTELVVFWRQNTKLNNSFKTEVDGKAISHNFCEISWCSFIWTFNLVSSNLTCPDETQSSNWNTQQAKVPSKHSYTWNGIYTILSLELIFFMPAGYGVKTTKKQNQFWTLENRALEKIAFKNRYESADPLYKNLKIIRFKKCLF